VFLGLDEQGDRLIVALDELKQLVERQNPGVALDISLFVAWVLAAEVELLQLSQGHITDAAGAV
jgi:Cdc6-like AAA superfamily ATPase